MLTHFYPVFRDEISGNAFLANLGRFILKIFQGSMPPDPPRRPKQFSSPLCGSKEISGVRLCPPTDKNLATAPVLCIQTVAIIFKTWDRNYKKKPVWNIKTVNHLKDQSFLMGGFYRYSIISSHSLFIYKPHTRSSWQVSTKIRL